VSCPYLGRAAEATDSLRLGARSAEFLLDPAGKHASGPNGDSEMLRNLGLRQVSPQERKDVLLALRQVGRGQQDVTPTRRIAET
jgi:hypothetical protein